MKSGYHHIDLCPQHQQFLGFQWSFNSAKPRYFCFTVLPFGLSSAPYLFTKFFKPLIRHWRSQGFRIVLFLDDGAGCENDFDTTRAVSDAVRHNLLNAGIVPNVDKSIWEPVQTLEWLGLLWLFREGSIAIPALRGFRPILPEHLVTLVSKFAGDSASLSDIRDVTLCLLGFAGFFRYSDISNLKWCNVIFHDAHMSIFISRSKTDQLHVGSSVVIAKTGHVTCPYTMLLRFASMAQVDLSSEQYIFGKLTFHRRTNSYSIRLGSRLSYTRTREVIGQKFKAIGLDISNFCLHSLRMGGATTAANQDVSATLIKKHGRWKSDKSKELYCREDLKHQLSVSLNLGL